jgi:hypothetical protein
MKIIAMDQQPRDITTKFIIELDDGRFAMYCQTQEEIKIHDTPEFFTRWYPGFVYLDDAACMWDFPKWLAGAIIYNFSDDFITRPLVDMADTFEVYSAHLH